MSTRNELTPARQAQSGSPSHESETAARDLESGAQLYWYALRHRVVEPDPHCVASAQAVMAAIVAGKSPAFLRQILELVADQFCEHNGRHIDNGRARLAALRDACRSFPTLDWTADIFPVLGHA
jgi:hypothetical protein